MTQTFSKSCDPSVWRTIPILKFLIEMWENMLETPHFDLVHDAIVKGLDNLAKWYSKTDDNAAYFICLGAVNKDHHNVAN